MLASRVLFCAIVSWGGETREGENCVGTLQCKQILTSLDTYLEKLLSYLLLANANNWGSRRSRSLIMGGGGSDSRFPRFLFTSMIFLAQVT